jgi:rare lipoprotein A
MRARLAGVALLTTGLLLSGCSTLASRPPLPPAPAPEILAPPLQLPPDVIPRAEPRSRYGNPASYEVFGRRYFVLADASGFRERGTASWYGPGFHGERTSSGEPYDMYAMTAAHKTLPLPAYVRVENLGNGRAVVVRVNDRGPFVGDRIIDLSYSAAARLDMLRNGTAPVEITVVTAAAASDPGAAAAPPAPVAVAPVVPAPVAPATQAVPSALPITGQFVQAGAFGSRDNAERLASRLRAAGFSGVELQPTVSASGAALLRVCIGPVASAVEADDVIERLALAGIPDARLVHPQPPQ